MKYQNLMLTIIAGCLIIITLLLSRVVQSGVFSKRDTYDVRITGVGVLPSQPLRNSLPVTINP
jgi:hypothetical protein